MAYNKTWLLLLLAFATQCSGVGIDIITSGNDAKDAGDATVRYLDPLGDLALEGVRAGQPIPDLVSPTYLITSDSTFRNVRCQTLYVQGNCRLRVIGGLEIDRILPMPNSSVPPTLHIFDAGASVSTFAADFSTLTSPALPKGGSLHYYSSGPAFSGVSVTGMGGNGTEANRKGGNGGRVELAHCKALSVFVSGGDGFYGTLRDPESLQSSDGGAGGNGGIVSIKSGWVSGGRGYGGEPPGMISTVDPLYFFVVARGGDGAGGRDGQRGRWNAGRGGRGGDGGVIQVDAPQLAGTIRPAFGYNYKVIESRGGRGGSGGDADITWDETLRQFVQLVPPGDGGNAGSPGKLSMALYQPPLERVSGGLSGRVFSTLPKGTDGVSNPAFVSTPDISLSHMPTLPDEVLKAEIEFATSPPSQRRAPPSVTWEGWRIDQFAHWQGESGRRNYPRQDLSVNVIGARQIAGASTPGLVGEVGFPYFAVVRGNVTNVLNLDEASSVSFTSTTEPNRHSIPHLVLERRYYFSAPYYLWVTNRCEYEPLMLAGTRLNSAVMNEKSVINSPLETAFRSQKARIMLSYGPVIRSSAEQQVIVAQRIRPSFNRRFPILGADIPPVSFDVDALLAGVRVFPPGRTFAPQGMVMRAIPDVGEESVLSADNLHISDIPNPSLPGIYDYGSNQLLAFPRLSGCGSCIHIHWRWDGLLDDFVGAKQRFGNGLNAIARIVSDSPRQDSPVPTWDDGIYNGQYIRPRNSTQTMDVALTDGKDFESEWELRNQRLQVRFPADPGQWGVVLLSKSKDPADTFFSFGMFVRTVLAEVDHSMVFEHQAAIIPNDIDWGPDKPSGPTTGVKLGMKPSFATSFDGRVTLDSVDYAGRYYSYLLYANAGLMVKRAWLMSTNAGASAHPIKASRVGHFLQLMIPPELNGNAFLLDKRVILETATPLDKAFVSQMLTNAWVYRVPDAGYARVGDPIDAWCAQGKLRVSVPASVRAVVEESPDLRSWKQRVTLDAGEQTRSVFLPEWNSGMKFFRVSIPASGP